VVAVGDDAFDLVVEGDATVVSDVGTVDRVAAEFPAKYPWWHPVVHDGAFYPDGLDGGPAQIYKVTPAAAFGFGKEKGFSATRWRF
jgi:hypothetical protein